MQEVHRASHLFARVFPFPAHEYLPFTRMLIFLLFANDKSHALIKGDRSLVFLVNNKV